MRYAATVLTAVLCLAPLQAAELPGSSARNIQVHMLSGSKEYRSEACLTVLRAALETQGITSTISVGEDKGSHFPDLEALEKADVLLVFARRMELGTDPLQRIQKWCRAGKPVVALRTGSHAFQTWSTFDREVLGGRYSGHDQGEDGIKIDVESFGHPILGDQVGWTRAGKLYHHTDLAEDVTLLLTAQGQKGPQPVAWCRVNAANCGRVFYTSMGCIHDFADSRFIALVHNAIRWAAGELPAKNAGAPRYWVAQLGDIEAIRCPCGFAKRAFARPDNKLATMHIVDITQDSRVHYHKDMTEIYLVLEGEGHLELDGAKVPVKPLTAVFIHPGCRHRAVGKMRIVNVPIPAFDPADEWFD